MSFRRRRRRFGEPAGYDGPELEAGYGAVSHFRDRILGLAGRDPGWSPAP
jgi:hypothetical protein